MVPDRLEEVESALLAAASVECRKSSERLGVELDHFLGLLEGLLLPHSLLLWWLVGWMKELILSVEETDEDDVEVLVGFLFYQVVA